MHGCALIADVLAILALEREAGLVRWVGWLGTGGAILKSCGHYMGVSVSCEISFLKICLGLIGGEQHIFMPSSSRGFNISHGLDGHIRERRSDSWGYEPRTLPTCVGQ